MAKTRARTGFTPKLISVAVASCFVTSAAFANPTGPAVVNGTASFHQQGNLLQISNSPNAIINWQSFSIGASEITRFLQQSASSAVLNRVIAQNPSSILGALQSNGRVFLINPNGILFGVGAQIDVAGLVASTLNLSNADFLAGRMKFTEVPGAGAVVNQGAINAAAGGQVYLVGPSVKNEGLITSPRGEVILAAGNSVELVNPGTPNLRVEISAPDNEARNLGTIVADAGRVGIYAGLINHAGTIRADTVEVGANGEILLKASKNITLEPESTISASGAPGGVHDGGTVRIVAGDTLDVQSGSAVRVEGGVDGGNGGFLELSGRSLRLQGDFSGLARKDGYANGSLLLDPFNLFIQVNLAAANCLVSGDSCINPSAGLGFGTATFLADNDLTVVDPITNADFNGGAAGGLLQLAAKRDVLVQASIGTAGTRFDHDLTLKAGRNVNVNRSIYLGSELTLAANATDAGLGITPSGTGSVVITPTTSPVVVDTLGNMTVSGVNLNILGGSDAAVSVNVGGVFNANLTGNFLLQGGSVFASDGDDLDASATLQANAVSINAGGSITVAGGDGVRATATSSGMNAATATSNATLSSTTTVNLTGSTITIRGGDPGIEGTGGAVACCGNNTATVNANATVSAGTTLTMTATQITVRGGDSADADASYGVTNTAATNANATLSSGGNMTLTATSGGILIRGGDSASASASSGGVNNATTSANALVSSGGLLTVNATGGLTVRGGNNASASASGEGLNTALVNVNATMQADSMNLTVASPLLIQGGSNASAEASCCGDVNTSNTATINTNARVSATNGITVNVNGGSLTVAGGNGALAEPSEASGQYAATVNAKGELVAGGNIAVNATGGSVTVRGGDSASVYASASSAAAQVTGTVVARGVIAAGGNLNVTTGSLTVRGGDNASIYANGTDAASRVTGNIDVDGRMTANGTVTIDATSLTVRGGDSPSVTVYDYGQNSGLVTANGLLLSGSTMTLNVPGASPAITVRGGDNARASASNGSAGGRNEATVSVGALISGGAGLTINAGDLTVAGGVQSSFNKAYTSGSGSNFATTLANANIVTIAGDLGYTGGAVTLQGGTARSQGAVGNNTSVAEANAGIQIAGAKTMNITGDLMVLGGSALDTVPNLGGATARAVLDPGAANITTTGDVVITGGSFTGNGSAFSSLMSTGPMNLTIGGPGGLTLTGGATGPFGTGLSPDPTSPITITFTGGGTQTILSDPLRNGASIRTSFFSAPQAPPLIEPPPNLIDQVVVANNLNFDILSDQLQGGEAGEGAPDDKKRELPVCR